MTIVSVHVCESVPIESVNVNDIESVFMTSYCLLRAGLVRKCMLVKYAVCIGVCEMEFKIRKRNHI